MTVLGGTVLETKWTFVHFCECVCAKERRMLPNLAVITFLENYVYFVNTLDTIESQWEIFVFR